MFVFRVKSDLDVFWFRSRLLWMLIPVCPLLYFSDFSAPHSMLYVCSCVCLVIRRLKEVRASRAKGYLDVWREFTFSVSGGEMYYDCWQFENWWLFLAARILNVFYYWNLSRPCGVLMVNVAVFRSAMADSSVIVCNDRCRSVLYVVFVCLCLPYFHVPPLFPVLWV